MSGSLPENLLCFLQEAEGLKSVERTAWTSSGRRESTAEHSWRLALLAWALLDRYPRLDHAKVLALCLVHDLGERDCGDRSASDLPDPAAKRREEQACLRRLAALLPATQEARLVKALDKAETILQHNQGQNPPDFDYDFNLDYGKAYFQGDLILEALRDALDRGTRRRMEEQQGMR